MLYSQYIYNCSGTAMPVLKFRLILVVTQLCAFRCQITVSVYWNSNSILHLWGVCAGLCGTDFLEEAQKLLQAEAYVLILLINHYS